MKNKKEIFQNTCIVCVVLMVSHFSSAQNEVAVEFPVIGQPIPAFEFIHMKHYSKGAVDSDQLKGKWVILDFFAKGCSSCFESFPKINKLYNEFQDSLTIILVGSKRGNDDIEAIYEKFRVKQKLDLPVTFESELLDRWRINGVPFQIWIDDQGIVKAVTSSQDFTASNIQLFLRGAKFNFVDVSYYGRTATQNSYSYSKPLLIDGNGGNDSDFIFRSLLAKWEPSMPQSIPSTIDGILETGIDDLGKFQVMGAILEWLYELAYFGQELHIRSKYGQYYHRPILETSDSSIFTYDFRTGRNVFNYSLIAPKERCSRSELMNFMQSDLKNYFGFQVSIENKKVPYWALTVDKNARDKLKGKGGVEATSGSHSGYFLENVSVSKIIEIIAGYHQQVPPFIDETGIDYKVTVRIDALMTDLDDVIAALKKEGLILSMREKVMPALVIRDLKQRQVDLPDRVSN